MRQLVLFLPLLLAACDSSTLYTADLGQRGTPVALKATLTPPSANGQVFKLVPDGSSALPAEWLSAQTLKVQVNGMFVPAATESASPAAVVVDLPPTSPLLAPLSGSLTFAVLVDSDHVEMAQVKF